MVDKNRVLSKIDELDRYLREIKEVIPATFKEYQKTEKKRSCERLLQLCIECAIDIAKLFVSGLKLGLPSQESDLLTEIRDRKIISAKMARILKEMRGFRNILIHEYAAIDDELVYEKVKTKLGDFKKFKQEILKFLNKK